MILTKLLSALTLGWMGDAVTSATSSPITPTVSSSGTSMIEVISIIGLTILIAYIVGVMISQIVDRKLGEIEIRMPQINVPEPKVSPSFVIQVSQDDKGRIKLVPGSNKKKAKQCSTLDTHPSKTTEPFLNVELDDGTTTTPTENATPSDGKTITVNELDYPIVVDVTKTQAPSISKIGCVKDSDCNVVNGNGQNVCKSDGTCHCISGSGLFCQYGPTNYKDPKDMTPDELERFKSKYRNNMTLQDYKNWLMLYKDEIEEIREHHRKNLFKLLRGGVLTEADVPAVSLKPPTSAADYFQTMYKGGKISVHFPDNDSPLVGSNYTQFKDFIPPENTASSWITGVVDLYKEAGKDDAKAVDFYMRPEITNGKEESQVGDVYQKYLRKYHDVADIRQIATLFQPRFNGPISLKDSE